MPDMPEVIVRYKRKKTLAALQALASFFDYEISLPEPKTPEKQMRLNGVTLLPADSTIDTTELTAVFTGRNIEPATLRSKAWQRKK